MTRILRFLRRLWCDHRFRATGVSCHDDDGGFEVECLLCGRTEWLCCDCPADCEVCA